jgi:cytochrome c
MRKAAVLMVCCIMASCKNEVRKETTEPNQDVVEKTSAELGKEIFEGKGRCFACHKPDQKIVGPSIREIAAIYKDKHGDIVSFLKGNEKPLVDPEQFEVMKANFEVTKTMTDDELEALETYIYSQLQ